jgi:tRNA(Ile)-lysidine synthase
MSLELLMLEQLKRKPNVKRWVVAFSGGLDSTVLLHLLVAARDSLSSSIACCALHINHQLSLQSDQWQQHCQNQCQRLNIPFFSEKVDVTVDGKGVEAAARDARYQVFSEFLNSDDALVMGHHRDDQAETFLLRLMRGAGVLGLSSMAHERKFDDSVIFRPLLDVSRQQLEAYAKEKGLTWVEDESNQSLAFDRNLLRHEIIPRLESRWPQVKKQLVNTVGHLQQSQRLLGELAEIDLQQLDSRKERCGVSIDWNRLRTLSMDRISNVLRFWCQQQSIPLPNTQQMAQIHEQFFSQNAMLTSAIVQWAGYELRQFNRRLYLMKALENFDAQNDVRKWDIEGDFDLGQGDKLIRLSPGVKVSTVGAKSVASLNIKGSEQIEIRWRQGGERCTPVGRSGSQTVKKLLQEYQLETWLRDRVPLVYIDGQLAAVGDLWVCEGFAADQGQASFKFFWFIDAS